MKDTRQGSNEQAFPTMERPYDWLYTDADGRRFAAVLTQVGERQVCDVLIAFGDGWRALSGVRVAGTRGETEALHLANPSVKV